MSTYTPIASFTLGSATSSITLSNIPQNYIDLVLVSNWQASGGAVYMQCQVNGDTGSNYGRVVMAATTSPVTIVQSNNTWAYVTTYAYLQSGEWGNTIINFNNYSNTNTFKTFITRGNSASIATEEVINTWRNTSAINSIYLQTNANSFGAGSTFSLYGIEAGTPKAQGGNIVTTDGTYWYHTFLSSGTLTTYSAITADYLVVAGGGGAANTGGVFVGGGGAGGLRCTVGATGGGGALESALSLSASQTYTITVGAGGRGGQHDGSPAGISGSNSSISGSGITTITSIGGGGSNSGGAGNNGGSGGGGAGNGGAGGTGTSGQGYAGGTGNAGGSSGQGGGGGGAGAAGQNGGVSANTGGNGGNGVTTSISGTSTTYAGGGGGAGATAGGSGGTGGGGAGKNNGFPNNGTVNTGGGGGATNSYDGGSGGSGIVIIRYAV
jgi:hypothetical protein